MIQPRRLCVQVLVGALLSAMLLGCPGVKIDPGMPLLSVTPHALDFGKIYSQKSFTVVNDGGGVLSWVLNVRYVQQDYVTPASVTPWLGADTMSGSTTTETDRVILTANRSVLLLPGTYHAIVTVTRADDSQTQDIRVAIAVEGEPTMSVEPATIDLVCPGAEGSLTITNDGSGDLDWVIDVQDPDDPMSTIPALSYLKISPSRGTTRPGESTTVEVSVNCDSLPEGAETITLLVTSGVAQVEVGLLLVASGEGPALDVDPLFLDFGTDLNELFIEVFNIGALHTVMDFEVSTDREDLILLDPIQGTSIGVGWPYDRQRIDVLINREAIDGDIDTGTIFVVAPDIGETIEVSVRVEAAPLSVEGAVNRSRPPSVMRFVFLLRDSLGQAIETSDLDERDKLTFYIDENEEPLDLDETNFFVRGPENLKTNIVLLLDYTGSMYNAGQGNGTAIELMENAAKEFIRALPEGYQIAIMEYHDRNQGDRVIANFDTNKDNLIDKLERFSLDPAQHGASEMRDAIVDAVGRLADADSGELAFDDADVRAVVFISDGRDTSSVADLAGTSDTAVEGRVRLYPIGFGEDVNSGALVSLSVDTGGHYYSASDALDLARLLGSPAEEGLIWYELKNQIVLTYVSLLQAGTTNATYNITITYEEDSGRLNEGSFERDAIFWPGDSRAGQISLRSAGIKNGQAEVFVRADYVPRNVTQLRFRFFIDPFEQLPAGALAALMDTPAGVPPYEVELVEDGILVDRVVFANTWWLLEQPEAVLPDAGENFVYYTFTNEDNPLQNGLFGNLIKVTFNDLDDFLAFFEARDEDPVFNLGFRVDNRIYGPPTEKWFEYPGGRLNPDEVLRIGLRPDIASPARREVDLTDTTFDPDGEDAWNQDADDDEDPVRDDFNDRYPDDFRFH